MISTVPEPSSLSVHVAPSSVYEDHFSTFTVHDPLRITTGGASIHVTVAIAVPVLPARSRKVNNQVPLPVKVMLAGVCPVIASENPVKVTTTLPVVNEPEPGT
jgi:hypothetical protein